MPRNVKVGSEDRETEFSLEDKDAALVLAINELTLEIRRLRING